MKLLSTLLKLSSKRDALILVYRGQRRTSQGEVRQRNQAVELRNHKEKRVMVAEEVTTSALGERQVLITRVKF